MSATGARTDEEVLRAGAGAVRRERDAVRVTGPDATSFLQGQLSQDLELVGATGASAWSLLLQPQGKVDALLRITRVGPEELMLDTDSGWGPRVLDRLSRFKLRVRVDLELLAWRALALRGPGVRVVSGDEAGRPQSGWIVPAWPTETGVDVIGPDPLPPSGVAMPWCDESAYEVIRIEAGVPTMGRELTEATIPAEAGVVSHAVSFTKGCYTGQELVARIDSRGGNVPRRLWGLISDRPSDPSSVPAPGSLLNLDGREVGTVTSAAHSTTRDRVVALALVRRGVAPPAEVALDPVVAKPDSGRPGEAGDSLSGRLVELPFAPP
ncbi:MAG: CAF17-like 4Fe-4S cluster assembly/insertion protein YgfZ [Acidimicrobiales bacterium]